MKGFILKKILVFLAFIFKILSANDLEFSTLESDFTQVVTSKDKSIIYSGHFIADSNFSAFWEYKTPNLKLVYFSKSNITILEPDLEQAVISNLSDAPDISALLAKAKQVDKNAFEASFDDIKYLIFTRNSLPAQISYTDKLGNAVKINLTNTRKNKAINKKLLEPKIPKNYDIVTN